MPHDARSALEASLRDDSRAGAGWDVMGLEDGEALFSRRCGDEAKARYVARAIKQDNMRGGEWIEEEQKAEKGGAP